MFVRIKSLISNDKDEKRFLDKWEDMQDYRLVKIINKEYDVKIFKEIEKANVDGIDLYFPKESESYFKIISNLNKGTPIESIENINDIVKNKEDLYNFVLNHIENMLGLDEKYINYPDLRDFLVGILFDETEIKQDATILHILPETPFIFSCVEYMRSQNPEFCPHLYIITLGIPL